MPSGVRRAASEEALSSRLLAGTALGVVMACTAVLPAAAQTAPAKAPVQLPTVSVEDTAIQSEGYKAERASSPKFTQPLVDTPKTITIIPKEVIDDRGATSLTDVLRTVPGISLGAGEGGIAMGDRTFIRGFDARGDVFVDGARDFGAYFRDPFNLEQVEIIKGPSSAYTGRGSTGGAINQVTKTPRAENFWGGDLTLGTDMTKRATIDVNQVVGDTIAFRVNAMAHDQEVAGRDEVEQQRWGFAPSLTVGLGRPTQVTFSYFHLTQNNIPDYGHPFDPTTGKPIDVDRDNFYGLVNRDFDDAEADIGTVRFDHEVNEMLSLRNQLRYGRTTRDFIVTKPEVNTSGPRLTLPGMVTRSVRSRDSVDTNLANQTDLTSNFATGFIEHTLVTGIELSRETSENKLRGPNDQSLPQADRFHPNPNDPFSLVPSHTGAKNEATVETIGIYAFDTAKLSEQWELVGGVRWDRFDTDFTRTNADGTTADFDRVDKIWSWNAAAVYKPLPNASVYVSYGTSANPSAEFLTLSDATVNTDPEKTRSYELGAKWDLFQNRLSVTAAVFRTEKTDARIDDPLGGPSQVLDGEQRVDGFEIGIAGSITERWQVFGGYTFLDSEIVKSDDPAEVGNEFPNIAPHNLSIWTTYDVTREIGVGFGATYADPRYANTANNRKLPPYWRLDAMASYQLTQNVGLRLNILNITDETIYDSTHNGQHALVAPGRTALLTTVFNF